LSSTVNIKKLKKAVTDDRKSELQLFQYQTGIKFKDLGLLNLAFIHRSYANENGSPMLNNERLEFLGDSVLGLVVCEYLYERLPQRKEGYLAKVKSFAVSEDSLAEVALKLKVDNFILIGKGEEASGGRYKKALLADCMEAIIGAHYLDAGYKSVKKFVLAIIKPVVENIIQDRYKKDYKTMLQELVQKRFKSYPRYILKDRTGPDHDRTFWMSVEINGAEYGPGKGKNKKQAEQMAAEAAYMKLTAGEETGEAKS
jgi:ribonuclease-3